MFAWLKMHMGNAFTSHTKQNYRTGSFFDYNKSGAHSWYRLIAEQAYAFLDTLDLRYTFPKMH